MREDVTSAGSDGTGTGPRVDSLHAEVTGPTSERAHGVTRTPGSESDLPLLLVHGFTGSSAAWPPAILASLAERRRVIAVDLPGHGQTRLSDDGPWPNTEATVDRLVATLDGCGASAADWIGYSMGGRMALAAAALRPDRVRHLVLESASPGFAAEEDRARRRAEDGALAEQIEERGIEWFVDHWTNRPMFETQRALPQEERANARTLRLGADPRQLAGALRALGTGAQPSFWSRLGGIGHRCLLVTGGLDSKFTDIALRMSEAMPRAFHVEVAGVGHTVHLEAPELWLGTVSAFLEGDPRGRDQA